MIFDGFGESDVRVMLMLEDRTGIYIGCSCVDALRMIFEGFRGTDVRVMVILEDRRGSI